MTRAYILVILATRRRTRPAVICIVYLIYGVGVGTGITLGLRGDLALRSMSNAMVRDLGTAQAMTCCQIAAPVLRSYRVGTYRVICGHQLQLLLAPYSGLAFTCLLITHA